MKFRLQRHLRYKKAAEFCRGRVLDVGCGKKEFAKYVDDYTGINNEWNYKKLGSFDTVTLIAVIEHIPYYDLMKVIDGIRKNLKPDGRIVITTPKSSTRWIFRLLPFLFTQTENHKKYWSREDLEGLAKRLGKKLTHYETFAFGFNQLVVME